MVLFKVPVEEKIPEPPKAAKKPERVVVPPKEEATKKEKGTFMFLLDLCQAVLASAVCAVL